LKGDVKHFPENIFRGFDNTGLDLDDPDRNYFKDNPCLNKPVRRLDKDGLAFEDEIRPFDK
jgi:hypothetical protein